MYLQQIQDIPGFPKENRRCLLDLRLRVITPAVLTATVGRG